MTSPWPISPIRILRLRTLFFYVDIRLVADCWNMPMRNTGIRLQQIANFAICILCGTPAGRAHDLSKHLKRAHRAHLAASTPFAQELQEDLLMPNYCHFCEVVFHNQHVCPILIQLAILHINGSSNDRTGTSSLAAVDIADDNTGPWQEALQLGTMQQLSTHRKFRDTWSHTCCFCRCTYSRSNDLMHHLQLEHSILWTSSLRPSCFC